MAGNKNNKKSNQNSNDMTRIEDLSQLIHREDPEIEALFRKATNLPELPSEDTPEETPEETPAEVQDESSPELPVEFSEEEIQNDFQNEELVFDSENLEPEAFASEELQEEPEAEFAPETQFGEEPETESEYSFEEPPSQDFSEDSFDLIEEVDHKIEEEELKNELTTETPEETISLQDFRDENTELNDSTTFGHLPTTANPAYSLKIENLDPKSADDIIDILSDYDLLKNNSEKDYRESLKSGALLISQQSEFLIIHLATRLKRFGASMIMGPSDKIFSSKILGAQSARGKVTKKIKDQSKKGTENLSQDEELKIEEQFLMYMVGESHPRNVIEDHGPIYATEVIDEEDLLRSSFAQKSLEQKEKIQNEELPLFEEYAELIDKKKEKLQKILKAKAISMDANAIINMQFLMNTQSVKKKTLMILTAEARAVKIDDLENEDIDQNYNEVKNEL